MDKSLIISQQTRCFEEVRTSLFKPLTDSLEIDIFKIAPNTFDEEVVVMIVSIETIIRLQIEQQLSYGHQNTSLIRGF